MIRWYDDIRCIIIVTNLLTNVYINVLTFFAHRWNCTYLNYVWNAILRYLCFGYIHILCLGANKLDIIVIFWRNFTTMKCRSRAVEHFTLKYNYSANNNRTFGMMVRCRRGVCTYICLVMRCCKKRIREHQRCLTLLLVRHEASEEIFSLLCQCIFLSYWIWSSKIIWVNPNFTNLHEYNNKRTFNFA